MAHTTKTDKIMKLFGGSSEASNPAIKPPEHDAVAPVFVKSTSGTQLVNVGFLLINEQLGSAMERFNCCTCEECIGAVSETALKNLPLTIIPVKRKSDEAKVNKAAAELRTEAIKIITKAVISVKTNPPHGKKQ